MLQTHKFFWFLRLALLVYSAELIKCNRNMSDISTEQSNSSCKPRIVNNDPTRIVCVCDETTTCDKELHVDWPTESKKAIIVTSSMSGKRFQVSDVSYDPDSENKLPGRSSIIVKTDERAQTIMGWGGAFTDATGIHLAQLSDVLVDKLLASLFGPQGLQYNFARVPIAGLDFSARPYSYDDTKDNQPDYELKEWSLTKEDLEYKIPFIQKAIELTNGDLKLFASPWSPPSWMKTSKSVTRGYLIDDDRIYDTYARYLVKFFDAYENQGIKFWGATVQNEPVAAFLPFYFFNSLQMSAKDMIRFVGKHYGPALEASNRTKDNFKLMIGDDNLGFLNFHVPSVMADPQVSKYISGLAFHWYTSGTVVSYDKLNSLYDQIKDKIEFVMMTEACTGSVPFRSRGVKLGDWDRGEAYASDMIEDLLRHTNAWIDFNMCLDINGAPNWAKNYVDSSIIVDAEKKEFYKQPMYYAMAHFSRHFRPNSKVIQTELSQSGDFRGLSLTAVHNDETGHVIINILNKSKQDREVQLILKVGESNLSFGPIVIERKSVNSIIAKL